VDAIEQALDWLQAAIVSMMAALAGDGADHSLKFQGYVEGEYVRVAAPAAGTLERLAVYRGDHVIVGDLLFELDQAAEIAARDGALARLRQTESNLTDLRKGQRAPEIEVVLAQIARAQADLTLSESEMQRREQLFARKTIAAAQMDAAKAAVDRDRARVAELSAQLQVAGLPARDDAIAAAEAAVSASRASLAEAEWRLSERTVRSPVAGFVEDTLYRQGEEVAAGMPVVSLLPPGNVKVRFFVPEPDLARLALGQTVSLACDSCPSDLTAEVSYVSPQAEYTPPVIYSADSRSKLVFLIEARPIGAARQLHPGQPVDVTWREP
jgi:HlyD family secretion protein